MKRYATRVTTKYGSIPDHIDWSVFECETPEEAVKRAHGRSFSTKTVDVFELPEEFATFSTQVMVSKP